MDRTVFRMMMGTVGSVTPPWQLAFTTPGTYSVPIPIGTYLISLVLIGGGGGGIKDPTSASVGNGGDGGSLRYINDLPVTPGETLTLIVGAPSTGGTGAVVAFGGSSFLKRGALNLLVAAGGFQTDSTPFGPGPYGGTVGGGNGGTRGFVGTQPNGPRGGGGGGAGGYSGNGGTGRTAPSTGGTDGSGGAGGGGGHGGSGAGASGGGGVGLFGEGASGLGDSTFGGGGGSGGTTGGTSIGTSPVVSGIGGSYGGGAGGGGNGPGTGQKVGVAGGGAARIIAGYGRSFPSTRTADE